MAVMDQSPAKFGLVFVVNNHLSDWSRGSLEANNGLKKILVMI